MTLPTSFRFWSFSTGLLIALVIAVIVRWPFFAQVPAGLNRDEAALGYNAYSLLKTGHDEFGRRWPVTITSFGDEKLPGYVYTLIPFIAAFDLSIFAVRLPSFLAGLVVIIAGGWLSWHLASSFFKKAEPALVVSWLTMLFTAVSPWGLHFSHVAYEAHLAMALFLTGLCLYHAAVATKNKAQQRWLLIGAATALVLTLFTYHSYHILTPLAGLILVALDWRKYKQLDRTGLAASVGIGLVGLVILYSGGVLTANLQKNQGISPFHKQSLQEQATTFREYLPGENTLFERVFVNSLTEAVVRFGQNLVTVPAGTFLFVNGTIHGDHNPGNNPNLHLFTAPLLLAGTLFLWTKRQQRSSRLLLLLLVATAIPSALTISPQHTIRFSPAFPLFEVIAAIGAVSWLVLLKARWQKIIFWLILLTIAAASVGRQVIMYWYIIPKNTLTNERYTLLGQTLSKYQKPGFQVITQSPTSSPYIWYLFESKYDPERAVTDIQRYPTDAEGFKHVKQVGGISFETINWDDLEKRSKTQPLILVFTPTETAERNSLVLLEDVRDSKGEVKYRVWQMGQQ